MSRRKITEEARQKAEEEEDATESESSSSDDSSSGPDREQLTQRMPDDLVEDVDEFADAHGLSRNAAINLLVREALNDR